MAGRVSVLPGRFKRKISWALVAVFGLAAIGWHASLRVPLSPAQGGPVALPGAPRAPKSTVRIGTFNIHSGRGTDRRCDLGRTANTLAGLDFVGLNEVAGRWPWQPADQAELLGRLTGQGFLFAPFERRWYCYEFGNALLTSLPVGSWMRIPFSQGPAGPRNVVVCQVGGDRRAFRAIVVHAVRKDPRQRDAELRAIKEIFLAAQPPAVLLGDLNAGPEDPALRPILDAPGVVDALAGAPGVPNARIDWILLRGLKAVRAGMVDQGASDHPLFWAEVELGPGVQ